METQATYRTNNKQDVYIPSRKVDCKCGRHLADEVTMVWYHEKRDRRIDSKILVVDTFKGTMRVFVRAELSCVCGRKVVWNG